MFRLLALLPALFTCGLAFAVEEAEVPMETACPVGIILFLAICVGLGVVFVRLTNKSSAKSAEDKAGNTQ